MFMIRTANSEVYKELVTEKKLFSRQIELFLIGLSIGIAKNLKSNKRPNHDIIRLVILESNLKLYKDVIDVIAEIFCRKIEEGECGSMILSYADGGIEYIWEEYLAQRILDLPRLYQETLNNWENISNTLITELKKEN